MRALGFTTTQIRSTVAWHASTVALVATAVGLPAGVIAGRQAWLGAARQIGIPEQAHVPRTFVVLAAVVAIAVFNVLAAWPARAISRRSPSEVLREE